MKLINKISDKVYEWWIKKKKKTKHIYFEDCINKIYNNSK